MGLINRSRNYELGMCNPRFNVIKFLHEGLERLLPSDAHIRCSGRLFVSMTRLSSGENFIASYYKTREDLISAILCSSFIPGLSCFVAPSYRDEYLIDGALSNNLPTMNQNTITISPFPGVADISPRDDIWKPGQHATFAERIYHSRTSLILNWITLKRIVSIFVPMSFKKIEKLMCGGYEDTLRFLLTRGLIACPIHRSPNSFTDRNRGSIDAENLESLPNWERLVRATNARSCAEDIPLSQRPLPKAFSPHMVESTSRNLLYDFKRPVNESLSQSGFDSCSFAVHKCVACRNVMLNSYVSTLPANLLTLIWSNNYESPQKVSKDNREKDEVEPWRFFSSISRMLLPHWFCPSFVAHQVLAQLVKVLVASTTLQVSAVRLVISLCIGLIKHSPGLLVRALESVVDLLTSFDTTLKILVEKGKARTEKVVALLCSNEGLDKVFDCLVNMIHSDLLAFLPQLKPPTKTPFLHRSRSVWMLQEFTQPLDELMEGVGDI